jgi:hypothetical protein
MAKTRYNAIGVALMSLLVLLGLSLAPTMMSGSYSNVAFATTNGHIPSKQGSLPRDWSLEQTMLKQLNLHRGSWVGMTECDQNRCHIVYLGPEKSNPHTHGINTVPKLAKPIPDAKDPNQNAAAQIQPTSYPDGSPNYNTPAETEQDFTAQASSNSHVDYLMVLNGWTGSNTHWIQSVLFYDEADETGTGVGWYAEMDSWSDEGVDDYSPVAPPTLSVTTSSQSDNFAEKLFALGNLDSADDGCYEAAIDDTSNSHGYSFSKCYTDDTAANMQLTSKEIGSGSTAQAADAGSMSEDEATDSTSVYYWGSEQYNLGFYNSIGGTEYTSVNGWTSTNGGSNGDLNAVSCASNLYISPSLSGYDTMHYTAC